MGKKAYHSWCRTRSHRPHWSGQTWFLLHTYVALFRKKNHSHLKLSSEKFLAHRSLVSVPATGKLVYTLDSPQELQNTPSAQATPQSNGRRSECRSSYQKFCFLKEYVCIRAHHSLTVTDLVQVQIIHLWPVGTSCSWLSPPLDMTKDWPCNFPAICSNRVFPMCLWIPVWDLEWAVLTATLFLSVCLSGKYFRATIWVTSVLIIPGLLMTFRAF